MGRPAMGRNTLRLSRVELSRAGITPAIRIVLMQASLQEKTPNHHPFSPCIPHTRSREPAQTARFGATEFDL
jgi:hypothetical protein